MTRIDEDLGDGFMGLLQMVEGLDKAYRAADAVLGRVDGVVAHLGDTGTMARVVRAGVGAVVEQASREIRGAASYSRPAPARELVLWCGKHGQQPWRGTIFCGGCGRVYQIADSTEPRFAPLVCGCMRHLLPVSGGNPGTALPICSSCYLPIAAGSGVEVRSSWPRRREQRGCGGG